LFGLVSSLLTYLLGGRLRIGRVEGDDLAAGEADEEVAGAEPGVGDDVAVVGLEGQLDGRVGVGEGVEEKGLAAHVDGDRLRAG